VIEFLKINFIFKKIPSYNLRIIKNRIMNFPCINVLNIDVCYQLEKHVLKKNDDGYNFLC
jgi:hypothetical protein